MEKESKTYVMGDIHGGYKALLQCLERSGFDKEKDTLIQLGDVADGWSEVSECVDELLSIKNLIPIRGNHDKWCQEWMETGMKPDIWINQGGQATFDSYLRTGKSYDHLKAFFGKQHNYYVDDKNRAFVHGGFTSIKGLGREQYQASYFWDRSLWASAMMHESIKNRTIKNNKEPNNPPIRLRQHEEIFIGHTSTVSWDEDTPMRGYNVWNLDTGGGFYGKLTIMDVDTKEYWQSDQVKTLYPDEHGR